MTISVNFICNECTTHLDKYDISCKNCIEKEKEEYGKESIKTVVLQFLKGNRETINSSTCYYAPDYFSSKEEMEIFLKGVRSALEFAKISIIVDCLDYDIQLEYLYEDKNY